MLTNPRHQAHARDIGDHLDQRNSKINQGDVSQRDEVILCNPFVDRQLDEIRTRDRGTGHDDHKDQRDQDLPVIGPQELHQSARHFGIIALIVSVFRLGNK